MIHAQMVRVQKQRVIRAYGDAQRALVAEVDFDLQLLAHEHPTDILSDGRHECNPMGVPGVVVSFAVFRALGERF